MKKYVLRVFIILVLILLSLALSLLVYARHCPMSFYKGVPVAHVLEIKL